ncbi:MAG: mannonate dehydratase [Polaromonas sp.]|nr:mannonate dehydratase [Polaromonas sp.]
MTLRICDMLPAAVDRRWALARQLGVRHAICKLNPELTGAPPPSDFDTLKAAQRQFADHGLVLSGLEGDQMDMHRIKQGLPGRDADIDAYKFMLQNMGRLGIRLLCYNFMVGMNWGRTQASIPIRGGARASGFDAAALVDAPPIDGVGVIPSEQVWDNYRYFIERVGPVAAEHGVMMGLHPDDPPVPQLRGVGRIFGTVEGFERALALLDLPSHGVTFCQATFGLVHPDVAALATRWGRAGRIPFIHWRDVVGTAGQFHEVFHDDGPTDMGALLQVYDAAGIDAFIRVDHVPAMEGEFVPDGAEAIAPAGNALAVGYETMGRLFAVGYLKGLLEGQGIAYE